MYQQTLALLNQTLRTDSRKLSVHLFLLLFIAALFFIVYVTEQTGRTLGAPGLGLFSFIVWINYVTIVMAGASYFSVVISEEKESGTLNLLKLTGLTPLVLILGKSSSRILLAMFLLSVQIPFVMLAVTLGGVTLSQIAATYICLCSFLILIANMGLFASLISESVSASIGALFFLAGVYFILYSGFYWCLKFAVWVLGAPPGIMEFAWSMFPLLGDESSYHRLTFILSTGFDDRWFTPQVWGSLLWAAFMFVVSLAGFEGTSSESFHDQTDSQPETEPAPVSDSDHQPDNRVDAKVALQPALSKVFAPKKTRKINVGRSWESAIAWKEFHFQAGGFSSLIIKLICYGLLILLLATISLGSGGGFGREQISLILMVVGTWAFVIEAAVRAGTLFRDEIRDETLSALVTLPLFVTNIFHQKVLGCLIGLLPSIACAFLGLIISREFYSSEYVSHPEKFQALAISFMEIVVFLYGVVLVSLYLKWGGLPMTIFIYYVSKIWVNSYRYSNSLWNMNRNDFSYMMWIIIFMTVICCVLHCLIIKRIKALAAR